MQRLWSRVLAGEANAPGTFSRRTVNLLQDLDKGDAELFRVLCGFGWAIGNVVPLVYDVQAELYNSQGITFSSLAHLETLGFVKFENLTGFVLLNLPSRLPVSYYGRTLELSLKKEPLQLDVGKVLLTHAGQELAPVCGSKPIQGFFEYVFDKWTQESLLAETTLVVGGGT